MPVSLQELCRFNIRSLLRENLQKSFPDLLWRTKCILKTNSEENQRINTQEQLVQLIRVQCGLNADDRRLNVEGLIGLRSLFETFSRLDETMSDDTNSVSDNDLNDSLNSLEELDVGSDSDDSFSEYRKSFTLPGHQEKLSDETTKRKSPEAGCSESPRTMEKTENSKRMKMNLSSSQSSSDDSTSTYSDVSDAWDTCSSTSSNSSFTTNNSFLPTAEVVEQICEGEETANDVFEDYENETCSSDSDDQEPPDDLDMYKFISDCKENELSKLLKDKIDSLPIPVPLKKFLNYYRIY